MIQDDRLPLKEKFLEYYEKMPIQKYAGYAIGKSEDTIKRWIDEDEDFADRILKLKSSYLLAKSRQLPATFIIPLLFRELTPRTELTGKEGEPLNARLTDEQLDKQIEAKLRKVGVTTAIEGEGKKDSTESTEIR